MQKKLVLFAGLLFVQPLLGSLSFQQKQKAEAALKSGDPEKIQAVLTPAFKYNTFGPEKALKDKLQAALGEEPLPKRKEPPTPKPKPGEKTAEELARIQAMPAYQDVQRAADRLGGVVSGEVYNALIDSLK